MPKAKDLPHDNEAEQAILGSILLSRPAEQGQILDLLAEDDFHIAAHKLVFAALREMRDGNTPADLVTFTNHIRDKGELEKIGGAAYVTHLFTMVPSAVMADHYTEIVKDKAMLRKLRERAVKTVAYCDGKGDFFSPDHILNHSKEEFNKIERWQREPPKSLADHMQAKLERMESGEPDADLIPTGIRELDRISPLRRGDMPVIKAKKKTGKALCLNTPIPTPTGWTTMGEVQAGDYVLSNSGHPIRVVAVSEVMKQEECFDVEFSTGYVITAAQDHLWHTQDKREKYRIYANTEAAKEKQRIARGCKTRRGPRVKEKPITSSIKTTGEIFLTKALQHCIRVSAPLVLPPADLPIDPYVLGLWIGDGHSSCGVITIGDQDAAEITANIRARGQQVRQRDCAPMSYSLSDGDRSQPKRDQSVQSKLRALNLINNKHVPGIYLRGSFSQRLALLRGLMDSDGWCSKTQPEFYSTNPKIIDGVMELIHTLGIKTRLRQKSAKLYGRYVSECWCIGFTTELPVFGLSRKLDRQKKKLSDRHNRLRIADVRRADSVPVKCIQVESSDGMFLAGEGMIPTHNSILGLTILENICITHKRTGLYFSLEDRIPKVVDRIFAGISRIPADRHHVKRLSQGEIDQVTEVILKISEANIIIYDDVYDLLPIVARARKAAIEYKDLSIIVVDYAQLIRVEVKKSDTREREVATISRAFRLLAMETGVPIILISQVNNDGETRESRALEQDCTASWALIQDDDDEPTERLIRVEFQRNGESGVAFPVRFLGNIARVENAAPMEMPPEVAKAKKPTHWTEKH